MRWHKIRVADRAAASGQAAPQGDAKAGQQVYLSIGCWECHGQSAQGGAITGPRLAHTALPFAAVLQQLRVPQNQMPPYEAAAVSDADVANIYAWLEVAAGAAERGQHSAAEPVIRRAKNDPPRMALAVRGELFLQRILRCKIGARRKRLPGIANEPLAGLRLFS